MRKIQIEFEYLGKFTAELLEDKAPEVCNAIWKSLPLRGAVTQARYSGMMLYSRPPSLPKVNMENVVKEVMLGDVGYWHGYWEAPSPQLSGDYTEIGLFYGKQKIEPPLCVFARITQGMDDFEIVCKRIQMKGPEEILVEKQE